MINDWSNHKYWRKCESISYLNKRLGMEIRLIHYNYFQDNQNERLYIVAD